MSHLLDSLLDLCGIQSRWFINITCNHPKNAPRVANKIILKILQISDLQEKQKRSTSKLSTETKVREVKKIANAKLKSCAEILQVIIFSLSLICACVDGITITVLYFVDYHFL